MGTQSALRAEDSALGQTVSHAALQLRVNRGLIGASFARSSDKIARTQRLVAAGG